MFGRAPPDGEFARSVSDEAEHLRRLEESGAVSPVNEDVGGSFVLGFVAGALGGVVGGVLAWTLGRPATRRGAAWGFGFHCVLLLARWVGAEPDRGAP